MDRPNLPLNALRAFEVASRHLNLTRAAVELCVTQAALSHQIRGLEDRLGVKLFRRVPRGLMLTEEGVMLAPLLTRTFDDMSDVLDRFSSGKYHETINLGVVNTFATEWLIPRISGFQSAHPTIDIRILSNNNRVDLSGEGLDLAIRFGDGNWHGTAATYLTSAPMTVMCSPEWASKINTVADLLQVPLLRSYRANEWEQWFAMHNLRAPALRGPVLDSSLAIAQTASRSFGIALLPICLFHGWVERGLLMRPFSAQIETGSYWLTRMNSAAESTGQAAFREWLISEMQKHQSLATANGS